MRLFSINDKMYKAVFNTFVEGNNKGVKITIYNAYGFEQYCYCDYTVDACISNALRYAIKDFKGLVASSK